MSSMTCSLNGILSLFGLGGDGSAKEDTLPTVDAGGGFSANQV